MRRARRLVIRCGLLVALIWAVAGPGARALEHARDPAVLTPPTSAETDPIARDIETYEWRREETRKASGSAVEAANDAMDWFEAADERLRDLLGR